MSGEDIWKQWLAFLSPGIVSGMCGDATFPTVPPPAFPVSVPAPHVGGGWAGPAGPPADEETRAYLCPKSHRWQEAEPWACLDHCHLPSISLGNPEASSGYKASAPRCWKVAWEVRGLCLAPPYAGILPKMGYQEGRGLAGLASGLEWAAGSSIRWGAASGSPQCSERLAHQQHS